VSEPRCLHDLLLGHCAECKVADVGLPVRVVITRGGKVFHRDASCPGLVEGQEMAVRAGMEVHPPQHVAVTVARGEGRGVCLVCFPDYQAAPNVVKPCLVLRDGNWVEGNLVEWRRDDSDAWVGVVATDENGLSVTRLVPATHLRPRE
jgi:hypothetical protein